MTNRASRQKYGNAHGDCGNVFATPAAYRVKPYDGVRKHRPVRDNSAVDNIDVFVDGNRRFTCCGIYQMNYVIPVILVLLVLFAAIKRVNVYDAFVEGGKESMLLVKDVFPYLAAIFILIELFKTSGLTVYLTKIFEKPFAFFGIPKEVTEVMILRPFSGAGSVALLENIFKDYGADSYVGKCAAVIIGSSETIFYVCAVYFSKVKVKNLRFAIPISLVASFSARSSAAFS